MKKYIIIFVFVSILAVPTISKAQSVADIKDIIINTLNQVIALQAKQIIVLKTELATAKEQLANGQPIATQCPVVATVAQNTKEKADELRKEYALKFNEFDKFILALQKENAVYGHYALSLGASADAWRVRQEQAKTIENNAKIADWEHQKRALRLELERKLIELGEF